jgi:hypothetical protein
VNTVSQTLDSGQIRVHPLHESPQARPTVVPPVDALYQPHRSDAYALPLDLAMRLAREDLAVQQGANVHDHEAMIRAAVTLEVRLRGLLAAMDADASAVSR